jgi:hypothetical protein
MSWAARTGGLRASPIPAWFRYETVRMSKILSMRCSIMAYSSLEEFRLGIRLEALDRRQGFAKQ